MSKVIPGLAAFLAAASWATAQDVQQQRILEEERRREMDEQARTDAAFDQPFVWDVGGWIHSEFIQLDDAPDREQRTLRYLDLRLWAEARISKRYVVYVRSQTEYTDFNSGDQFESEDDNELRAFHIDQAYVEGDLSSENDEITVRLGRQFYSLGRGLLFNGLGYGGMGSWSSGRLGVRAFLAHSIIHDDDIDQSLPNNDDSRRAFGALELNYRLDGRHRVYGMALVERDLNKEDPENALQDWDYNANYLGAGARGQVAGDLHYALEGTYEFGSSIAAGSTEAEDIRAFAFTVMLDYRPEAGLSPYFAVEYLFGSGDGDRGSVTDTASGNLAGTDDEGFLPFGFVQTGYSLFPRLSNIHIFRLGGSFRPLESVEMFRYLEVGAFGYLYRKDEADAPISDSRSFLQDVDVGKEVDLFLRWRVASDVGISINYGRFMPGDAYAEQQDRDFISAGMTYSF